MIPYINSKTDVSNLVSAAKAGEIDSGVVIDCLEGLISGTRLTEDVQLYPEGYGEIGYEGEELPPIWEESENKNAKLFKTGLTVAEVETMIQEVKNV